MLINELIEQIQLKNASSIHLSAGVPPFLNVNGRLYPSLFRVLAQEEIDGLASSLMNEMQEEKFARDNSVNFTYERENLGRYHINFFKQKGLIGGIIKTIPAQIKSLSALRLPEIINEITKFTKGLVVISGPAGAGKSTTLAAIIDAVNSERSCHIVTLEDPIEYFHSHKKSLVSQREMGADSLSFSRALKEAIRQDADVIMVGEMRDLETISVALTAAETGILVIGTMHTADSVQVINRIISSFPTDQQQQVRTQLAMILKAVIAQQLVMTSDGNERIPVAEILLVNQGIQNMIRDKKTHQIYSAIENGAESGMQTMDQALQKLYQQNLITDLEVVTKSVTPVQTTKKNNELDIPPASDKEVAAAFIDAGEEMISVDRKLIKYQANFMPGLEGYWTSSVVVSFKDEGLTLIPPPGIVITRIYISDFNIVSNKISPFALPKHLLVRFKMEISEIVDFPTDSALMLKLFTQPEGGKFTSYNKINLSYPLLKDTKWHTWVINIPPYAEGKVLKIYMLEFPIALTKCSISDIIFF